MRKIVAIKTICVLTGTRAEFGLLRPIMDAIMAHPELELQVLVTGTHLEEKYGLTVGEIESSGYPISAKVPLPPTQDSNLGQARAVGEGVIQMAEVLTVLQPDFLLVLGDRAEVLSGVVAALFLTIPVAHLHGGDVTRGGTDEATRHAITKMASLHFPATPNAQRRILSMGEDPWRVHLAGAPCLDTILHTPLPEKADLADRLHLPLGSEWVLVLQHSVSTEPERAGADFLETTAALEQIPGEKIFIYPNSDPGGREIIRILENLAGNPGNHVFPSLPHSDYLGLLAHSSLLIGNSSSGVIESSSFKIPVINIGIRQEGRERGENVVDAEPNRESILTALEKIHSVDFQEKIQNGVNPYGRGIAGKIVADVLAKAQDRKLLVQKKYFE